MSIVSFKNPTTKNFLYVETKLEGKLFEEKLIPLIVTEELTDVKVLRAIQFYDKKAKEITEEKKERLLSVLNENKLEGITIGHNDIIHYRNGEKWIVKNGSDEWLLQNMETLEIEFFQNFEELKAKLKTCELGEIKEILHWLSFKSA